MPTVFQPNDAIAGLTPLSWRGIVVPIGAISTDTSHDIAEHKSPDVDGSWLEETGIASRVLTVRCILRNGVTFDPSVVGASQQLFPAVRNKLVAALRDGSTGDLVHPTEGALRAKVRSWKETITPGQRDGSDIDVTFEEDNEGGRLPTQDSPQARAYAEAVSLDSNLALLRLKFTAQQMATLGVDPAFSFADALRRVQGAIDTVSLAAKKAAGSLDSTIYAAQNVVTALDTLEDVTTAAARRAGEALIASMLLMKGHVGAPAAQIGIFIVPPGSPFTVARLAVQLGTSANDLMRLNPVLYRVELVREGTRIRYPL
jgi:prophage DNA circulation protein